MSTPSTDVALPSDNRPITLRDQIPQMEHQFALAAPRGVEARQLVRDALTCLRMTPKLAECEPATVLGGLMTMAQLGLRPGVLGHGWLLPFRNRKSGRYEAQLVIGYQGILELAHRSNKIGSISARTVFANDHFHVEYGIEEKLVHRPAAGDRGEPVGYYAVVRFSNGGHSFWHMTHEEMALHRDQHAMAKDRSGNIVGPWRDHFEAMAHKTCVRKLAKFMPKSTDLAIALAVDDTVRMDLTPTADPVHVSAHVELGPEVPVTAHLSTDDVDPDAQGEDAGQGS